MLLCVACLVTPSTALKAKEMVPLTKMDQRFHAPSLRCTGERLTVSLRNSCLSVGVWARLIIDRNKEHVVLRAGLMVLLLFVNPHDIMMAS